MDDPHPHDETVGLYISKQTFATALFETRNSKITIIWPIRRSPSDLAACEISLHDGWGMRNIAIMGFFGEVHIAFCWEELVRSPDFNFVFVFVFSRVISLWQYPTMLKQIIVQDYTVTGRHLNVHMTHKCIKTAIINTYWSAMDHKVTCIWKGSLLSLYGAF